jgi:GH15 family glucan-1,4-alpha-glucosidase
LTRDGDGGLRGEIDLPRGATVACVLGHARTEQDARALLDMDDWVEEVEEADQAWKRWSARLSDCGRYTPHVLRSALTLRMLTFEPTGALVAAPTTSLPEAIGGVRNWDYRYCWLRDATFTLYALLLVGDTTAAGAFWGWIERTCTQQPVEDLQIMYGIHGERDLPERSLPHLSGYRDSRPVRVGNAAYQQRQLDIYGELLDALWFYWQHCGVLGEQPTVTPSVWMLVQHIAGYICEIWREPDQGIWEIRAEPRQYVYSKVMCWVGLDRAVRLAAERAEPGQVERWVRERDAIRAEVLAKGYSEERGAFTIAYGSPELDAANLRMVLVGFLPAGDPRMRATIERTQEDLQVDGFVMRYTADDGLPGNEGAISICTFWLIDCLTALGRIEEAHRLFDNMLAYANDLGLFAEEIDPATGAALGNYPQAFTHLALIDAAVDLNEALERNAAFEGEHASRAAAVHRRRRAHDAPTVS